jgi:hypothetical protein
MSIDYNEFAAYLESLHHRLSEYRLRQRQNGLLLLLLLLSVLVVLLVGPALIRIPLMMIPVAALYILGIVWVGKRIYQTSSEARELEKEVELLRYRLVADDVSLGKIKRKAKRDEEIDAEEVVDLSQFRVGDDGELILRHSKDEIKSRSNP